MWLIKKLKMNNNTGCEPIIFETPPINLRLTPCGWDMQIDNDGKVTTKVTAWRSYLGVHVETEEEVEKWKNNTL